MDKELQGGPQRGKAADDRSVGVAASAKLVGIGL